MTMTKCASHQIADVTLYWKDTFKKICLDLDVICFIYQNGTVYTFEASIQWQPGCLEKTRNL